VAFRQWPRVIERRLCFFSSASSDGRRNTPLIGWFHNSLQKEPISQAVLKLHLGRAVFSLNRRSQTSLASEAPALRLRASVVSTH